MSLIDTARQFAEIAHAGQTRKGPEAAPYTDHLAEVAALVAQFGGSEVAVSAAWLHDTVEDCQTAPEDLRALFGAAVAALVLELTDDKSLPKERRKALQVENAPHKSPEAALVKICDKISNIRAVGEAPPVGWSAERRLAYLDWAESVVLRLPAGADPARAVFAAQLAASRRAVAAP
ncbi:HD domain-containing protein [Phaeovulum sp.]|uniref:HD domain-containing protein n=1 Tax=Phaeovulum sp. TaxID=2934796 RepID=UPI0035648F74